MLDIASESSGQLIARAKILPHVMVRLREEIDAHKQGKAVQQAKKKRVQDTFTRREPIPGSTPSSTPSLMEFAPFSMP